MSKGFVVYMVCQPRSSAMTKVKARQHVNFMSYLIQHKLSPIGHGMAHMAAHSMWSRN